METVWSIVVAGGSGLRFGSRKQFADLAGISVLQRSVNTAAASSAGVVVVVPDDAVDDIDLATPTDAELVVVAGGTTRAGSVRNGLRATPGGCEVILVHDAARPLATAELFESVITAVRAGADAVVPAVAIADTIRHRTGGVVDRDDLLAVQTPQGFPASTLRSAHAGDLDATDDATLVERGGGTVVVVEGETANRKITDPVDLLTAAAVLNAAAEQDET